MSSRPPVQLALGDRLRLRRAHPCGSSEWLIDRLGADIGLSCAGCGRRVLLERAHVERRLEAHLGRQSALLGGGGA